MEGEGYDSDLEITGVVRKELRSTAEYIDGKLNIR